MYTGGEIMLQAWAFEQGSDSKRSFETQDTMVPLQSLSLSYCAPNNHHFIAILYVPWPLLYV